MRYATIGHKTFFLNHFVEKPNRSGDTSAGFNFNHYSWEFIGDVVNYNPDISLLYRPELYPRQILQAIPGMKIGYSTEPLPKYINGKIVRTGETKVRERMYRYLQFNEFHELFHYDINSKSYIEERGWRFSGYRHIPINTDWFNPFYNGKKLWDVVFIGKATDRRNAIMDFLRMSHDVSFLWVAHGVSGYHLSRIFKKSRCVLNIHADDTINFEPRIYLAAACGIPVVSEPVGIIKFPMQENVFFTKMGNIDYDVLVEAVNESKKITENTKDNWKMIKRNISVREFMLDVFESHIDKKYAYTTK
jgi:hypothetical protein